MCIYIYVYNIYIRNVVSQNDFNDFMVTGAIKLTHIRHIKYMYVTC